MNAIRRRLYHKTETLNQDLGPNLSNRYDFLTRCFLFTTLYWRVSNFALFLKRIYSRKRTLDILIKQQFGLGPK